MRVSWALLVVLCAAAHVAPVHGEVLVRWDQHAVPAREALGLDTLLIPFDRQDAILDAGRKGYRVFVEVSTGGVGTFTPSESVAGIVVRGDATDAQIAGLRTTWGEAGSHVPVFTVEERGKWPHVRLNAVTRRNDVLQVASRSAQPWLENNLALARIADLHARPSTLLSYPWLPLDAADEQMGPDVAHYLVAVAEAASAGASLVLPLHSVFQQALLKGAPDARRDWAAVRRALAFHAWEVPRGYEPVADVSVVSADPWVSFEILNLLARHNVPFTLVAPAEDPPSPLSPLVIVADPPGPAVAKAIADAEAAGAIVVRPDGPVVDPDAFAMDVRNRLGRSRRAIDIWNGITVLVTPWRDADDGTLLLGVVNYAHEPRPVQLRVQGLFTRVMVETPDEDATLIPFTHRDGQTEFVLPSVAVAARVFLMPPAGLQTKGEVP